MAPPSRASGLPVAPKPARQQGRFADAGNRISVGLVDPLPKKEVSSILDQLAQAGGAGRSLQRPLRARSTVDDQSCWANPTTWPKGSAISANDTPGT